MGKIRNYLLIDVGTGSSRIALMNSTGKLYDLRHIPNHYETDHFGGTLINVRLFMERIEELSRQILAEFPVDVHAITVSGARQTFFLTNEGNQVVAGIPNIDSRGARFIKQYADINDQVRSLTARDISADFLAMKLVGLRNDLPKTFNDVSSFTSLSEVFALILTGNLIIEPSQAEETQFYDMYKREWNTDLVNLFGFDHLKLPKIVPAGTTFEIDKTENLRKFGILNNDCIFVVGGADTQLAMQAIAPGEQDDLCLVSGTTSPVCVRSDTANYSQDHWLDVDLKGERYVYEYNPGVTGLNYERARNLFCPEASYDAIENSIDLDAVQEVTTSLTTQTFRETGSNKKLGGMTWSPPLSENLTGEQLTASVALDIGFAISKKVRQLEKMFPGRYHSITAVGGGMNSKIIPQVVASLTGKKVMIYSDFQEPSIIGCFNLIQETTGKSSNDNRRVLRHEYVPMQSSQLRTSFTKWERVSQGLL